jgi:hypothetical protein
MARPSIPAAPVSSIGPILLIAAIVQRGFREQGASAGGSNLSPPCESMGTTMDQQPLAILTGREAFNVCLVEVTVQSSRTIRSYRNNPAIRSGRHPISADCVAVPGQGWAIEVPDNGRSDSSRYRVWP